MLTIGVPGGGRGAIYLQFLPIGKTVWQSSFEQKFGMTELENLVPPDMKKFWQERIEYWQDRMVGPHLKMTQLRLCKERRVGSSQAMGEQTTKYFIF